MRCLFINLPTCFVDKVQIDTLSNMCIVDDVATRMAQSQTSTGSSSKNVQAPVAQQHIPNTHEIHVQRNHSVTLACNAFEHVHAWFKCDDSGVLYHIENSSSQTIEITHVDYVDCGFYGVVLMDDRRVYDLIQLIVDGVFVCIAVILHKYIST